MADADSAALNHPGSVDARPVELGDDFCALLVDTGFLAKLREIFGGRLDSLDESIDEVDAAASRFTRRFAIAESGNRRDSRGLDRSHSSKDDDLDTAAAAKELGLRERRVRQLCASGDLRARRSGRGWLIKRPDLEDLKRRRNP